MKKKTGGRKSRWTVPLIERVRSFYTLSQSENRRRFWRRQRRQQRRTGGIGGDSGGDNGGSGAPAGAVVVGLRAGGEKPGERRRWAWRGRASICSEKSCWFAKMNGQAFIVMTQII